mmetsp:Transcript_27532/g.55577  ORF Transcript_27532/g.55577 Transcript_27532/m.55577 type:complete len:215 (-) Transcript_27532:340-984(-)
MSDEQEKPTTTTSTTTEETTPKEEAAAGGEEEEKVKEEESTATFEPVVKLEEVEVKSGEEDEEVVCSFRSKLFSFGETLLDKGTGNKTWKERGIGDARILRHREHQRLRFLMRQEKTMKVIANHALDPRIVLEPNAGSDRSWVWSCFDFSEGDLEEKVFALRFSNSEVATEFKEKYVACQKEMEALLAGEDKPDEKGEAGEAAAALEGLKTGEE